MEEKNTVETLGAFSLRIEQDTDAQSPEEWGDDALFLVADHRQFYVKPPKESTFESVVEDYKKTHHVFGLEAYIHSGVVLALSREGSFPDRNWDVSQLGAVFVSKQEWKTRKAAEKAARGHIETWNQYLSGDVYGFIVEDSDGEHVDSCWGFYGGEKDALAEGKVMLRHAFETAKKAHEAKLKAQIKNHVPLEKRQALTV